MYYNSVYVPLRSRNRLEVFCTSSWDYDTRKVSSKVREEMCSARDSHRKLRRCKRMTINSEEEPKKYHNMRSMMAPQNHKVPNRELIRTSTPSNQNPLRFFKHLLIVSIVALVLNSNLEKFTLNNSSFSTADASLIIGDSAIEIQEVDPNQSVNSEQAPLEQPSVILGSTNDAQQMINNQPHVEPPRQQNTYLNEKPNSSKTIIAAPLPPITNGARNRDDITDGDKKSRNNHDYDIRELNLGADKTVEEKDAISKVLSASPEAGAQDDHDSKAITGKVVDFELTPAGGHNKAKIKKKKKKKKKKEEEMFKKWGKKKESEKKAMEKKEKESMKKKKEEGKKKKKKWGVEEHAQKKKGKFKKKKWGKKVKKGKGVKKGKKGKKFLKDKGHKNTGFKTVYHKEEWGGSKKWHDIKREKKWDEKSKKWKQKWKKEKGKKYKGDHMKKFEKKKKSGKKYKKEKKDKFKKFKKEEFKKGKKMKKEEHAKKKEGGKKKEMKEMKKKKKKKS